jgi:hypothetical protein
MPTASGTSSLGLQRLIAVAAPIPLTYSIAITSQPLPPRRRVGFLYVFTYLNASPFQSYVIDTGIMYAPGIYHKIEVPSAGANFGYIVEVYWDVNGLAWTINT